MKLMTHVVLGYPTIQDTEELITTLIDAGADMIELQIPFSDPLADGPTIMDACEVALKNGFRVKDTFPLLKKCISQFSVQFFLIAYYNTVFRYGVDKFCEDAKEAGAKGLIVPDMPLEEEEYEKFSFYCQKYQLENIRVISPVSTDERLQKNAKIGSGFVYATARQGITGPQKKLPEETKIYLEHVKKYFAIPLAVGFGISKPEHIQALKGMADITIVGSAIITVFNSSKGKKRFRNVADFITRLKMVQ